MRQEFFNQEGCSPHAGSTSIHDEPATTRHWRRYVVMLGSTTLAAWSLAHLIAGSFSR